MDPKKSSWIRIAARVVVDWRLVLAIAVLVAVIVLLLR